LQLVKCATKQGVFAKTAGAGITKDAKERAGQAEAADRPGKLSDNKQSLVLQVINPTEAFITSQAQC
jgi:hypothetical protein